MRKLLPLLLALVGLGVGLAAGFTLRSPPPESPDAPSQTAEINADTQPDETEKTSEFLPLSNQFIIPLLEGEFITSLIVISLSLEVATGSGDAVLAKEPKLRDAFLQVLFDHANTGGFRGTFTEVGNLSTLRKALVEQSKTILGPQLRDVLITEIARQDS